jgi:sulfonate transport system permease protein
MSAVALTAVRSVPLLALIPLFSFWFGTLWYGPLLYIAFGIFVVTASDCYEASANLPKVFVQHARLLGARGPFILATIHLPGIASSLAASLKNLVGYGWAFALGAEYVSAQSGLGFLTYQTYLYSDMGKLAVFALVYMFLGYASFEVASHAISKFVPWISLGEGDQ